ncbi:MAG: ice-binding family protein [Vicinamibacterales bacterium]|jgi:hypothetical protein
MRRIRRHYPVYGAILALSFGFFGASPALAQTAPSLGNASTFAVLAGSTVTNTGSSVIAGNVGVSPGAAITGFPPGTVSSGGTTHGGNATAAAAQVSLTAAYTNLAGQATTANLTGQDLGTVGALSPGVFNFDTSAQLTGTLTLNAGGNADAVWIFKIGSTLTTASNSVVSVIGGGSVCNIYWQVGSSATLGTTTKFAGNILALTSITMNTGATNSGRVLARNGAVTLDTNTASAAVCNVVAPPGTPGVTPPVGCPVIGFTPATLPNGDVGSPYTVQFAGNSGTAPYVFTAVASTLPAGLTFSSTGLLTGTPTSSTTQTFVIRATDTVGCFTDRPYTMAFGTAVPTLPQVVFVLLGLGLTLLGYFRLRRPTSLRG